MPFIFILWPNSPETGAWNGKNCNFYTVAIKLISLANEYISRLEYTRDIFRNISSYSHSSVQVYVDKVVVFLSRIHENAQKNFIYLITLCPLIWNVKIQCGAHTQVGIWHFHIGFFVKSSKNIRNSLRKHISNIYMRLTVFYV